MTAENNIGRMQNSGLIRRRWTGGIPPFNYSLDLTEPAASEIPTPDRETQNNEPTPTHEVVLLGQEPRNLEK